MVSSSSQEVSLNQLLARKASAALGLPASARCRLIQVGNQPGRSGVGILAGEF
jgi:hypothetical protein